MIGDVKVKTSVKLSPSLLAAIDRRCPHRSLSDFLEEAAWDVIRRADKAERDARDFEILNRIAAGEFSERGKLSETPGPRSKVRQPG
jgi:hypothetical protein